MATETHKRDLSCLSRRDRQFLSVSAEIAVLANAGSYVKEASERLEALIGELNDEAANQDSSESTS